MAQHFVRQNFPLAPQFHFNIKFDIAQIHPQARRYWAVVGGFAAKTTPNAGATPGGGYERYVYIVALRQACNEYRTLKCWTLEKLAINDQVLVNRSRRAQDSVD